MILIFHTLHPPNRIWKTVGISLSFVFLVPQYSFAASSAKPGDIFPHPSLNTKLFLFNKKYID